MIFMAKYDEKYILYIISIYIKEYLKKFCYGSPMPIRLGPFSL